MQARLIRGTLHVVYMRPANSFTPPGMNKKETRFGPFYMKELAFGNTVATGAGVPFWSIAAVAMIHPSMALAAGPLRRRRRRRRNQCIHCGYSLQGLTEPRCPECGRGFG